MTRSMLWMQKVNLAITAKVYDFSLTRNATQMLVSVILLILMMTNIAKKYKKGLLATRVLLKVFKMRLNQLSLL